MRTRVRVCDIRQTLREAKWGIQKEARKMCGKAYLSTAFEEAEVVVLDAGTGLALVFRYRVITETNGWGPFQTWSTAL